MFSKCVCVGVFCIVGGMCGVCVGLFIGECFILEVVYGKVFGIVSIIENFVYYFSS